ncbi:LOW QUALITY PROTEIN: uncharacterized protein EMH_0061020 [Eimeria mitis]|uniref:Uncharacterized protein n=1 Tax=Eimeria mitis TaxID=44415 RepID=U6K8D8_9EIME|nr:LOW QUALITY PROTEIN: uncharacterized protein EMH_0061020 [Eimeria mitis]CDJ34270.1 hypothetical protein, conserved [Eimeria mitis]
MSRRLLISLCSAALAVASVEAEVERVQNGMLETQAGLEGQTSLGVQEASLHRKVGGRMTQPVMLVTLMAALLGLVFVVVQCVKNIGGHQKVESKLVLRRLAAGGEDDPCSVSCETFLPYWGRVRSRVPSVFQWWDSTHFSLIGVECAAECLLCFSGGILLMRSISGLASIENGSRLDLSYQVPLKLVARSVLVCAEFEQRQR